MKLAQRVEDQMVIVVPCGVALKLRQFQQASAAEKHPKKEKVNINTATVEEPVDIEGCYSEKGRGTIEYRKEANGSF